MATPIARLALAALALAAAFACTTTSSLSDFDEPDPAEVVVRYGALASPKALALATEANGRYAWGIATGEATEAGARSTALDRCRRAARAGGMRADCHLFAVDDLPAADTVEGCSLRRIPSSRCGMQKRYQADLGR